MEIEDTAIPDVKLIRPVRHGDGRGWLSELWQRTNLAEAGFEIDFVQTNLVQSHAAGTLRGLHFQRPPKAQGKLVAVLAGAVQDVVVDLRETSPTRGRHVAATLSAQGGEQLWVPPGFAHGYCTLGADCLVLYMLTAAYAPELEGGLAFDDPELAIEWAFDLDDLVLTERDRGWPRLGDLDGIA